mgnify:CR=1 FL=1
MNPEYTWSIDEIGLIIHKTKWDDQLYDCLVLYPDYTLAKIRLPHKLIYSDSSLDMAISNMTFYADFCAPNYDAPVNWFNDPIEWTFDSNDRIGLVIAKNQIDTDYGDEDFNLFKCVLITAGGFVERAIYRYHYQLCSDQTKINRMKDQEYKMLKLDQKFNRINKSIADIGIEFLNKVLRAK